MARAGIYTRISRDAEDRGLGVARQERECRDLAEGRGWEVVEVFSDNDTSLYRGKPRPGYEALIDALKAGQIDALVAWHPDRLHRSPRELEGFIDLIEATGAAIATVRAGDYDLTTASGRMVARVVGAIARHEVEQKSERQQAKALDLALAGKVGGGGTRPFGFEADRVTVRPVEAETIRRVTAELLGGASLRGVAVRLERDGITTPSGNPWWTTSLRRMLTSPRVAGLREHRGKVVGAAVWPAIIDRGTWEALRLTLTGRATGQPSRRYLLTGGLGRCGLCDSPLHARPKADGRRCYVCASGLGFGGCGRIRCLADPLEDLVIGWVAEHVDHLPLAGRMVVADEPSHHAGDLEVLEAQKVRLAQMWSGGEIDDGDWHVASQDLARRIAAAHAVLTPRRPSPTAAWAGRPGALKAAWDDLDIDQRKVILGHCLEAVHVDSAVKGDNRFNPRRVRPTWR